VILGAKPRGTTAEVGGREVEMTDVEEMEATDDTEDVTTTETVNTTATETRTETATRAKGSNHLIDPAQLC
jgi:hypothetical protein